MKSKIQKMLLITICLAGSQKLAFAVDSASLEVGTGNKTKVLRAGIQWHSDKQWFSSNATHLGMYWDATISQWKGDNYQNSGRKKNLAEVGITPVFRFQDDNKKGIYYEAGVGLHMLSDIYNNNDRHFSSKFQFGDHLGIGYVTKTGWDFGIKIQHFSNGGIKQPNPGVNYAVLKAGLLF